MYLLARPPAGIDKFIYFFRSRESRLLVTLLLLAMRRVLQYIKY